MQNRPAQFVPDLMDRLSSLAFGNVSFAEDEEYRAFQFKLLCVIAMSSWLLGMTLIISASFGTNAIESNHLYPAVAFTMARCLTESGESRQSMEAIQQVADQAMYLAKQAGRNGVSWVAAGKRTVWQQR
jgi:GGDEF domain-containing protein